MKHTETPWAIRDLEIIGPYKSNKSICEMTRAFMNEDEQKENIRHIVHCVNTHDELVKALEGIVRIGNIAENYLTLGTVKNAPINAFRAMVNDAKESLQKVTDTTPINQ